VKAKRVLVTGGNGHVGNTLAKRLCDRGYEVRVTVRNRSEVQAAGIFDGYTVEMYQADIRDEKAVKKALDGIDGVFQVAALYHYDERSLSDGIVANNTEGSQTVLRLAKASGVDRVVFTSSIAAVGFGGTREQPLTEQSWSDPADPYCRSKLESEKAAWEYANGEGLDMVALCPSIVLGPNFYKHTPSTVNVGAFTNNQVPFRFPMQVSVVDVRDVADAHILAYENKSASGRYLVAGTHVSDLIGALKELDPEMVLPERMLTLDQAKQLAEKSGMPVELVGQPYQYSDQRVQAELGWRPRPVAETLKDTIAWIKAKEL
jgi:dihydroflavonol-4-reductase